MARAKMVTRTIEKTEATVLTLNVLTAEPSNITVNLSGTFDTPDQILKAARKIAETDEVKLVAVVDTRVTSGRYGMPEDVFLTYAQPLDKDSTDNETID